MAVDPSQMLQAALAGGGAGPPGAVPPPGMGAPPGAPPDPSMMGQDPSMMGGAPGGLAAQLMMLSQQAAQQEQAQAEQQQGVSMLAMLAARLANEPDPAAAAVATQPGLPQSPLPGQGQAPPAGAVY